jgi:hypothetical protein
MFFAACEINSMSIKEIRCPKTEFPKKGVILSIAVGLWKNKTTRKREWKISGSSFSQFFIGQ